jgi:hypothetical protein
MVQAKVSISDEQNMFINQFRSFGFKNKSLMFRNALDLLKKEFKQIQLRKSADLYAEIYSSDKETRGLTESALNDWPE